MRQRRLLKAERKAGFSATVSARALIMRAPMLGSLAQAGISPQRNKHNWRVSLPPGCRTTATGCVGAMLNRGTKGGACDNSNCSISTFRGVLSVNRPHTVLDALISNSDCNRENHE